MKNVIKIVYITMGLLLSSNSAKAVTIKKSPISSITAANSEELYKASVTEEQFVQNASTLHIYAGQVVDRETAKTAFFNGETTCRVLIPTGSQSDKIKSNTNLQLLSVVPSENRKILLFINIDQGSLLFLTCQASSDEITNESIIKTLEPLINVLK